MLRLFSIARQAAKGEVKRTMRRMLLILRSFRMFFTEEYSLQSSGRPKALLASTVSSPSSYNSDFSQ